MHPTTLHFKHSLTCRVICASLVFFFSFGTIIPPYVAEAQVIPMLPIPGAMVVQTPGFVPALIKGITIHPENPLAFDFIIDTGDSGIEVESQAFKDESMKLIKYFLASLTVPAGEMWVNLSPYEQDRVIPESFGKTEMGMDLLAQDYILKQLTASLVYPEKDLGKKFWDRVYERAQKEFGTTDIKMDNFHKVWIVPSEAFVYEKDNTAFVVKSHLKVMLEQDYLALREAQSSKPKAQDNQLRVTGNALREDASLSLVTRHSSLNQLQTEIMKEIVLPEIEKEVNEGANFANLRQIYQGMILATWFKQNLKESLLGQVYVDQKKVKGVDTDDPAFKEEIYKQYVEAFEKGVYNYIKEDYDPATNQVIPRQYFSGGFDGPAIEKIVGSVSHDRATRRQRTEGTRAINQRRGSIGDAEIRLAESAPEAEGIARRGSQSTGDTVRPKGETSSPAGDRAMLTGEWEENPRFFVDDQGAKKMPVFVNFNYPILPVPERTQGLAINALGNHFENIMKITPENVQGVLDAGDPRREALWMDPAGQEKWKITFGEVKRIGDQFQLPFFIDESVTIMEQDENRTRQERGIPSDRIGSGSAVFTGQYYMEGYVAVKAADSAMLTADTEIESIGELSIAIKRRLNFIGVTTLEGLAEKTQEDIENAGLSDAEVETVKGLLEKAGLVLKLAASDMLLVKEAVAEARKTIAKVEGKRVMAVDGDFNMIAIGAQILNGDVDKAKRIYDDVDRLSKFPGPIASMMFFAAVFLNGDLRDFKEIMQKVNERGILSRYRNFPAIVFAAAVLGDVDRAIKLSKETGRSFNDEYFDLYVFVNALLDADGKSMTDIDALVRTLLIEDKGYESVAMASAFLKGDVEAANAIADEVIASGMNAESIRFHAIVVSAAIAMQKNRDSAMLVQHIGQQFTPNEMIFAIHEIWTQLNKEGINENGPFLFSYGVSGDAFYKAVQVKNFAEGLAGNMGTMRVGRKTQDAWDPEFAFDTETVSLRPTFAKWLADFLGTSSQSFAREIRQQLGDLVIWMADRKDVLEKEIFTINDEIIVKKSAEDGAEKSAVALLTAQKQSLEKELAEIKQILADGTVQQILLSQQKESKKIDPAMLTKEVRFSKTGQFEAVEDSQYENYVYEGEKAKAVYDFFAGLTKAEVFLSEDLKDLWMNEQLVSEFAAELSLSMRKAEDGDYLPSSWISVIKAEDGAAIITGRRYETSGRYHETRERYNGNFLDLKNQQAIVSLYEERTFRGDVPKIYFCTVLIKKEDGKYFIYRLSDAQIDQFNNGEDVAWTANVYPVKQTSGDMIPTVLDSEDTATGVDSLDDSIGPDSAMLARVQDRHKKVHLPRLNELMREAVKHQIYDVYDLYHTQPYQEYRQFIADMQKKWEKDGAASEEMFESDAFKKGLIEIFRNDKSLTFENLDLAYEHLGSRKGEADVRRFFDFYRFDKSFLALLNKYLRFRANHDALLDVIDKVVNMVNLDKKLEKTALDGNLKAPVIHMVGDFKKSEKVFQEYQKKAVDVLLNGNYVPQFVFAGKATRLKRGAMYSLDIWDVFVDKYKAAERSSYQIGMGPRQLIAYRMKLIQLAQEYGLDPDTVLKRQKIVMNLNDEVEKIAIKDLIQHDFYGFDPANIYFLNQPEFFGYKIDQHGDTYLVAESQKLVYGHGDNAVQFVAEGEAYQVDKNGIKKNIGEQTAVLALLGDRYVATHRINDLTKFLVEDVVDLERLALGIYLQEQGHGIVADLVANPEKQKGGTASNNGLIETLAAKGSTVLTQFIDDQGKSGAPYNAFRLLYRADILYGMLKTHQLPYYLRFTNGYFYLESVTGDLTQMPDAKTAFIQKEGEVIHDFKEIKNVLDAVTFLKKQDDYLAASDVTPATYRTTRDLAMLAVDYSVLDAQDAQVLRGAEKTIADILKAGFDKGAFTKEVYERSLANTFQNLAIWTTDADIYRLSPGVREANLKAMREGRWDDLIEANRSEVPFGTAGIRGFATLTQEELLLLKEYGPSAAILKGPNTINDITLLKKTQAVINMMKANGQTKVEIGYDSRVAGQQFAELLARQFIGASTPEHMFQIFLFDEASPFPELSFGVREMEADWGIFISASHNPRRYNGYKITRSNGAQLNQKAKEEVLSSDKQVMLSDIKVARSLADAKEGQLVWLGGDQKLEGKDYHGFPLVDMHSKHITQVKKFLLDNPLIQRQGKNVKIGFAAYNGSGYKAVPRLLTETGFANFKAVTKLQKMDGMFPAFNPEEQPDPGDPIAGDVAVREFIDEYGQEVFDELDAVIGTDPDADRMGLTLKVPEDQQKYLGKYRLLPANDTWTLLIWYRLMKKQQMGLLDPEKSRVLFSHVTTDALEATAELFGVKSAGDMLDKTGTQARGGYLNDRRTWVGFTYIGDWFEKLLEQGYYPEAGAEESNGFSIGGHVLDKDGTFAAILMAEVLAYAKDQGTTAVELLDNIYRQIGFYATANKPLPRVGSFKGAAGVSEKIKMVQKAEEWMKQANERAGTDNPLMLSGREVIGAVSFGSNRVDALHYKDIPDEGIRFFFKDAVNAPAGTDFTKSRNYITLRISGTSQTIRAYTQLWAPFNVEGEEAGKLKAQMYADAEAVSLIAQAQLIKAVNLQEKHLAPVVTQLEALNKLMNDLGLDASMASLEKAGDVNLVADSAMLTENTRTVLELIKSLTPDTAVPGDEEALWRFGLSSVRTIRFYAMRSEENPLEVECIFQDGDREVLHTTVSYPDSDSVLEHDKLIDLILSDGSALRRGQDLAMLSNGAVLTLAQVIAYQAWGDGEADDTDLLLKLYNNMPGENAEVRATLTLAQVIAYQAWGNDAADDTRTLLKLYNNMPGENAKVRATLTLAQVIAYQAWGDGEADDTDLLLKLYNNMPGENAEVRAILTLAQVIAYQAWGDDEADDTRQLLKLYKSISGKVKHDTDSAMLTQAKSITVINDMAAKAHILASQAQAAVDVMETIAGEIETPQRLKFWRDFAAKNDLVKALEKWSQVKKVYPDHVRPAMMTPDMLVVTDVAEWAGLLQDQLFPAAVSEAVDSVRFEGETASSAGDRAMLTSSDEIDREYADRLTYDRYKEQWVNYARELARKKKDGRVADGVFISQSTLQKIVINTKLRFGGVSDFDGIQLQKKSLAVLAILAENGLIDPDFQVLDDQIRSRLNYLTRHKIQYETSTRSGDYRDYDLSSEAKWLLSLFTATGRVRAEYSAADRAMLTEKGDVGGIDLNPEFLDLKIKRDGAGIPLPLPQQSIEQMMQIEGFLPVIINVTPIQSLPMLLGMDVVPDGEDGGNRLSQLDAMDKVAKLD